MSTIETGYAAFSHDLMDTGRADAFNAIREIPIELHPVSRGACRIALSGFQSRHLSIWSTKSENSFVSQPKFLTDVITLRFITSGAMLRRDTKDEHIGRPSQAMLVAFDRMRNEEASSDFASLGSTMTREALMRSHLALQGEGAGDLPDFAPVASLDSRPMQALMHTLRSLLAHIQQISNPYDLLLPLLEETLIYQVLGVWPRATDARPAQAPSSRLYSTARDFIEANLSRQLTLALIAEAAGVGVRSLQLAFRKEVGCSPMSFILARRLDRAHADLRSAENGELIGTIAMRWGFVHISDFSRRYRLRYGESPTQTKSSNSC